MKLKKVIAFILVFASMQNSYGFSIESAEIVGLTTLATVACNMVRDQLLCSFATNEMTYDLKAAFLGAIRNGVVFGVQFALFARLGSLTALEYHDLIKPVGISLLVRGILPLLGKSGMYFYLKDKNIDEVKRKFNLENNPIVLNDETIKRMVIQDFMLKVMMVPSVLMGVFIPLHMLWKRYNQSLFYFKLKI